MELHILFYLSIILISGLILGKIVKIIKLPNVTGYLIAGLIIGPSLLGIIPHDIIFSLGIIPEIALGFIAFTIGTEFKASYFKKVGIAPVIIAICEGLGAVVFIFIGLMLLGEPLEFSLVLASIGAATAPAATLMVVRQYRAKGPLTETLMSVVAIDDAVAIICFGFCMAIAKSLLNPSTNLTMSILTPILEIVYALIIGLVLGLLLTFALKWFSNKGNRLSVVIAIIFMAVALASLVNASALLTCMALGMTWINLCGKPQPVVDLVDYVTPPIFIMFFVISGAELNLSSITSVGIIGVVYIVVRVLGKLFGSWFGCKIAKSDPVVTKYLGWTLIPQAGVAIGLSLIAMQVLPPEYGEIIRTVVLCATFVYELVGPVLAKKTLQKAKEITI